MGFIFIGYTYRSFNMIISGKEIVMGSFCLVVTIIMAIIFYIGRPEQDPEDKSWIMGIVIIMALIVISNLTI